MEINQLIPFLVEITQLYDKLFLAECQPSNDHEKNIFENFCALWHQKMVEMNQLILNNVNSTEKYHRN